MSKKLLRPPQQGSSLTDKDGKPTSHQYRWMDGVTEVVSDLDGSVSTLTTNLATTNTNLANLTTTVNNLPDPIALGTAKNFGSGAASSYTFTIPTGTVRITLTFNNVTCNTASNVISIRLGPGTGFDTTTTGYAYQNYYFLSSNAIGGYNSGNGQTRWDISPTQVSSFDSKVVMHRINSTNYWTLHGSYICTAPNGGLTPIHVGTVIGERNFSSSTAITQVRVLTTGGANMTSGLLQAFFE